MISPTCSHLSKLSKLPTGPIAQIIRGGHRTEAIKKFAEESRKPNESYWFYTVLIPGTSINIFYC
jgi:hypothetical protein